MTSASIPVDLFNPGEVLASLGFLEAAHVLCGRAGGGFRWNDGERAHFVLEADASGNPFEIVLEFLATAEIIRIAPNGYDGGAKGADPSIPLRNSASFPEAKPERMALPLRLERGGQGLNLTHWCDGSSRDTFKLYAGNRSAARIVEAMLKGDPKKKTKGICNLWQEDRGRLAENPFDVLTPLGGSFNFDPRAAWTRLDAGYSPDEQKHLVAASPVVELLAAVGLEHGRPRRGSRWGEVQYAAWTRLLPPSLARAAMGCCDIGTRRRKFRFTPLRSGHNQVLTLAEEIT